MKLAKNSIQINTTINRYIIKELFLPFSVSILFFSFIFLMTKILDITNLIVNYHIGLYPVLKLLFFSIPYFLVFVIPISVMTSLLLTFLKMSKANEITALNSCGISLYKLFAPALFFCVITTLLTFFTIIYGMPWGRLAFKKTTYDVAVSNIAIGLNERTFIDSFDDIMLYVNKVDKKTSSLYDIFIEDRRTKKIISAVIAPEGKLFVEPGSTGFHIRLYNGVINRTSVDNKTAHSIYFDNYDIKLDIKKNLIKDLKRPKKEKEMYLKELLDRLDKTTEKTKEYYTLLIELHKKFSIPFACIALGIFAIPLGIHSREAKKSFGLGLCLLVFLLYYILLSAGIVFGKTGMYPPVLGMWLPNLATGGVGIYLFIRTANEGHIRFGKNWLSGLKK